MASTLFNALGWNDLLVQYKVKSWQETTRTISVALMVAVSSITLIFKPGKISFSCIPINQTLLNSHDHVKALAEYVNKECAHFDKVFFYNVPWIFMIATGLIFLTNNYWLLKPSVGAIIIKFDNLRNLFVENKEKLDWSTPLDDKGIFPKTFWKDLQFFKTHVPVKRYTRTDNAQGSESDVLLPQETCEIVDKLEESTKSLVKSYRSRNILSWFLALVLLSVMVTGGSFDKWNLMEHTTCKVELVHTKYRCVQPLRGFLLPGVILFILALIWHIVAITMIMISVKKEKTDIELLTHLSQGTSKEEELKMLVKICNLEIRYETDIGDDLVSLWPLIKNYQKSNICDVTMLAFLNPEKFSKSLLSNSYKKSDVDIYEAQFYRHVKTMVKDVPSPTKLKKKFRIVFPVDFK